MSTNPSGRGVSGSPKSPDLAGDVLRARLEALCTEGWALWDRFAAGTAERGFHPFVAADYDVVCAALFPYRGTGLRFLEWGCATGVITVMADMLGLRAYGIELDPGLVRTAEDLAKRFDSGARFVSGSFLPAGYRWRDPDGDTRTGTLGTGPSGYLKLGLSLDEFDVVFAYPWDGEKAMMLDLMKTYARRDAVLLLNSHSSGVQAYRGGKRIAGRDDSPASTDDRSVRAASPSP